MYKNIVTASHAKNTLGSAASPIELPKAVNGIKVKTAIPVKVSIVTDIDALL